MSMPLPSGAMPLSPMGIGADEVPFGTGATWTDLLAVCNGRGRIGMNLAEDVRLGSLVEGDPIRLGTN